MSEPSTPWMVRQVELVHPGTLQPDPDNPKEHPERQLQNLELLIRTVGWTVPLLVRSGKLVAGEGRWLVAQRMGLDAVPIVDLDHLTDEQARAYLVADNAIARTAYDEAKLAAQLERIAQEGAVALEAVGFTEDELRALESTLEPPPQGDDLEPTTPVRQHDRKPPTPRTTWRAAARNVLCGWSAHHAAAATAEDIEALLDALEALD